MDSTGFRQSPRLKERTKMVLLIVLAVAVLVFVLQIHVILKPFLWAVVVAYLLSPIVRYLNVHGRLPRLWAVTVIYIIIGLLLIAASRYLYPRVAEQSTLFLEDIPRLEASLIALLGPRPLGIDVSTVVAQLLNSVSGLAGNPKSAGHLLVNAVETVITIFLFLVTTFYLLMDGPRLKVAVCRLIPETYNDELVTLGQQINLTWQQYIRGELVLFAVMSTITTIALVILGVPGALFLGLASGALELLPLVGPITAGALSVSVAYFTATNPWGWSQVAYAGIVALVYFVLRQAEDYIVIPHVLGRAVRLHPLVVLFSVASGGIVAGLFGLIVAVPIAASLKAVGVYLYAKLLDEPVQFQPIQTIGGGTIEVPLPGHVGAVAESSAPERTGAS